MLKFCGIDNSHFGEKPNNPPKESQLDAPSISSYSSNYNHTVFITKNGVAMAAGDNRKLLISGSLPKEKIYKFTKFDIKDPDGQTYQPISCHCGEHFTLFLLKDPNNNERNILAYKRDKEISDFPIFLRNDSLNPVALFGGLYNAAAIDDKGSVIFLKQPDDNSYTEIIASHLPDGEKAVCVACCSSQIFTLSSTGKLFIYVDEITFSKVDSLDGTKIVDISGTFLHCLAISEDGKVFGFGTNSFGELGVGDEINKSSKFIEIKSLNKYKIKAAYAGYECSLFQTDKGKLLACGYDNHGVLLGKDQTYEVFFTPIETEITEGATFVVTGEFSSSVFINTIPLMSPNRRVDIEKVSSHHQSSTDEISGLKENFEKPPETVNSIEILDQKTVDDMNVIEKLGRGAQSEVFKVSLPQFYVLKIFIVSSDNDKSKSDTSTSLFKQLKQFIQEYDILRLLNHQNIIRTFGFCFGDETHPPSILLEFCPHNLSDYINELNAIQKVCVIFEICLGMEAVHAANLIHRDLKPENILIDEDGHIRVSDFGISCLVDLESQTQSKTTGIGTLKFMAPELLNEDKHYSNKVDVYSFGVVAFFILTGGKMPKISLAQQALGKKAQIPEELNQVSRNLINSCWSLSPDERPSFSEIIELIKRNNFKLIDGVDKSINQIKEFLSI